MKPVRWRWVMIGFAFLATLINYLDRQTLSVAAPMLRDQFHLSNQAYSHILMGFLVAYTVMNGVSGALIDRWGTKLGYGLCIAWWSAASVLHAFARGALSLGVCRFLLGMGEAGNWPAGVRVVAEWFPNRERAFAAGIFNSGSAAGAIVAPPLVAWILLRYGWRPAFAAVGVAGFLWLIGWLLLYRSPPEKGSCVDPRLVAGRHMTPSDRIPVRTLVRTRFVVAFTIAKVFIDPVWYFYTFWFPEYLKRARGFDLAQIGSYAWIPFAVAGFGNILGGALCRLLLQRGYSTTAARKLSVTVFALLMTSAIPAVLVRNPATSIALVSLAMLGYTGSLANMLAMPADVFPGGAVASVYGLASMGSGFGGVIFTFATGWAVDHYSYVPVFVGFGLIPLVCAAVLWLALGSLDSEWTRGQRPT